MDLVVPLEAPVFFGNLAFTSRQPKQQSKSPSYGEQEPVDDTGDRILAFGGLENNKTSNPMEKKSLTQSKTFQSPDRALWADITKQTLPCDLKEKKNFFLFALL